MPMNLTKPKTPATCAPELSAEAKKFLEEL